ncbi:hypothetical protein SD81_006860 [Tolypothrix campylonemoides VB511288]|nr:hypothetical protein SD81_006860 [Tolypothrix campylonemoides VB511288]
MSEYIATVLDTTGIQSYIFGSNRLRENIGASYLVAQATTQWVEDALQKLGKPFYFPQEEQQPEAKPHIEDGGLAAEVIYAGGGNTVLLFQAIDDAKHFTRILSSRILQEAPGLNIVVAHQSFDWKQNILREVIDNLIKNELDSKKQQRIPSVPLLGLGVTASCNSTQLVAIGYSDEFGAPKDDSYLVSREVKYKLKEVNPANEKLRKFFKDVVPEIYEFPLRYDNLGRTRDESSYIAVVHADGNSMGDRFKEHCKNISDNREYIIEMRKLSWSVNRIGIGALKAVVNKIVISIIPDSQEAYIQSVDSQGLVIDKILLKEELKDGQKVIYLPFRPLVYGGDDVTFVCDGRLGLTLAALFLQEFEKEAVDGKLLTACAGISIVKSHYPFSRAYNISESLCRNAKKLVRESGGNFSALDWHIAASGLLGSISEIRQREYYVNEGKLFMRPLRLWGHEGQWQNWDDFSQVVTEFNTGDDWRGRRNKVIALREVLRAGSEATKQFLNAYRLSHLPYFQNSSVDDLATQGWVDGDNNQRVCGYFDAIEAMEFYLPLVGTEA